MAEAPAFDAWYRDDPDPFGVRTRWYERRKLAVLLAALQHPRYGTAWDPACGTGDLALALADRCDRVVGSDLSAHAVGLSRALVAGRAHVEVVENALPDVPAAASGAELVVLSEVLYYLPAPARAATIGRIDDLMRPAGRAELVSVHWRHHPHDAHLSGADLTTELDARLAGRGWTPAVRHDDTDFVLATWTLAPSERQS